MKEVRLMIPFWKRLFLCLIGLSFLIFSPWVWGADDTKITLFCPNVPIKEAVLTAAFQAGMEVVFLEDVPGMVNLRKERVSFEKALDLILKGSGVDWYREKGVYYIGTPLPGTQAYMMISSTENYRLKHISFQELLELFPQYAGSIIPFGEHEVIISGPEFLREEIKKNLEQVDRPLEHILVKTVIAEVNEEALERLNVSLNTTRDGKIQVGTIVSQGGSFERLDTVQAELKALEKKAEACILASDHLLILEGKQGRVWVGEDSYFQVETETPAGTFRSLKIFELGSGLLVKPRYLGEEKIGLEIEVEFSDLEGKNGLPKVITRKADTSVTIPEGAASCLAILEFEERTESVRSLFEGRNANPEDRIKGENIVIFLEAERKSYADIVSVASVEGRKLEISSSLDSDEEYDWFAEAYYASLPIISDSNNYYYWLGLGLEVKSNNDLFLGGKLFSSMSGKQWLAELSLSYFFEEKAKLGAELKAFKGESWESFFSLYLEEQEEVEKDLSAIFRLGFSANNEASINYLSGGLSYRKENLLLEGLLSYQWGKEVSNWRVDLEGQVYVNSNVALVAGFNSVLEGTPIYPFDYLEFEGFYLGMTFRF